MSLSLRKRSRTQIQATLAVAIFSSNLSIASMPDHEYKRALQIAEKKALRLSAAANNSGALSSSLLKVLFGRYYQVGDQWEVAAWQLQHNMMRRTSEPGATRDKLGP